MKRPDIKSYLKKRLTETGTSYRLTNLGRKNYSADQDNFIDHVESRNKELTEDILEFTEFLLQDYEMDTFDGFELCWVLAGTEQKYSTKKIYKIWKALKTNKE